MLSRKCYGVSRGRIWAVCNDYESQIERVDLSNCRTFSFPAKNWHRRRMIWLLNSTEKPSSLWLWPRSGHPPRHTPHQCWAWAFLIREDLRHWGLMCGKIRGHRSCSFSVISFWKGSLGTKGMPGWEALILAGLQRVSRRLGNSSLEKEYRWEGTDSKHVFFVLGGLWDHLKNKLWRKVTYVCCWVSCRSHVMSPSTVEMFLML